MSTFTMRFNAFLEKAQRPGLLGLVGRRIEKRCREDLQGYFGTLGHEIINLHLERTVAHVSKELALHSVHFTLENTLRHRRPLLTAILETNLTEAMLKGDKIYEFAESAQDAPPEDQGLDVVGLTGQDAAAWAEEYAGDLITGIDQTTMQQIEQAIATGIEEQLGTDGTARLIRELMDGMTMDRARMIAMTETNAAMAEAALQKLNRLGIEYKRWIVGPDPCEICEDNASEGAIPVDDDFSSGNERPPAHPRCRCALVGARAPEEN